MSLVFFFFTKSWENKYLTLLKIRNFFKFQAPNTMDKIPLPVKIVLWIIILIFSILAIYCLIRLFKTSSLIAAAVWFFLFAVSVFPIAVIYSKMLSHWISRKTAGSVYWPGDNVELLPPDYSEIRSYIVKGDYYKAIEQLEVKIEEQPGNSIAIALLSDIYIDHLNRHSDTIKLLSDFLNRPERTEHDIPFVMKLVDALLEINEDERAERLLIREITLPYNEKDKEILNRRKSGVIRNS